MGAAITSIGLIARVTTLPLDNGKYPDDGSPNPKKPAVGITKFDLVQQLLDIMNNSKLAVKVSTKLSVLECCQAQHGCDTFAMMPLIFKRNILDSRESGQISRAHVRWGEIRAHENCDARLVRHC